MARQRGAPSTHGRRHSSPSVQQDEAASHSCPAARQALDVDAEEVVDAAVLLVLVEVVDLTVVVAAVEVVDTAVVLVEVGVVDAAVVLVEVEVVDTTVVQPVPRSWHVVAQFCRM